MTANIVAVGAINTALGIFSDEVLQEAVKRHIPKGTEDLNMKALEEGKNLMASYPHGQFHPDIA
jgi:2-oxoglutarate ferredoxin oxidoreductase subunit gamma